MWRGLTIGFALLLAGLTALSAQSPISNFPPGVFQNRATIYGGAAAGYTGPGNIFAFKAWYGFRAYSAATRGNKAVNVCDAATGAVCADWSTDATTGVLVPTTIGGSSCSVIACVLATFYDQTGATACAGSTACDLAQATNSARPAVTPNALNTFYCATFSSGSSLLSANSLTQTQAFSTSFIANRTARFTNFNGVIGSSAGGVIHGFGNTANNALNFNGVVANLAASDSAFHAVGNVANTTSSVINVDGTPATGLSAGTGSFSSTVASGLGTGQIFAGVACEMGIAATDQSSNFGALNTNMHAAYGSW